jgi:catechol 1,2-dioxygenase
VRELNGHNATEAVIARMAGCTDPRLRQAVTSVVRRLRAIVREVEPTHEEWMAAVEFLTAIGHTCTGTRQELVLLSKTLGVSMLVDAINGRKLAGGTRSTVLGVF